MNIAKLHLCRSLFFVIILVFSISAVNAQNLGQSFDSNKKDSVDLIEKAKQRLKERAEILKKNNQQKQVQKNRQDSLSRDPMLPDSPGAFMEDSLTSKKYQVALQEYYDYHVSGLKHRSKVFTWQLFSSKIIFAAVQFHVGVKQAKENSKDFNDRTEISASAKGIKVSSPVLGVIILVISLAFFYLYLIYVFPIEDIF